LRTKILFISSHIDPFKSIDGSYQRTNLLLKACCEFSDVDLIAFCSGVNSKIPNCKVIHSDNNDGIEKKEGRVSKFFRLCRPWDPYAVFPKDEYKANVVQTAFLKTNYDLIVTRYIPKAMECGLLEYAEKLVIDVDDLPSDALRGLSLTAKTLRNRIWYILISLNARISSHIILKKIHYSFFPNPTQVYNQRSAYLPNIPFFEGKCIIEPDFNVLRKRVLFVGDLDYYPNYKGVNHFLEHVYVHVLKKVDDIEFHIVGNLTNKELRKRWELIKGVKVLGFVDDLSQEYSECRVVVVPVYHGGGTNIKLLEAFQMKRTSVASDFATRGFKDVFKHDRELLVADTDADFAGFLTELLIDENKNKRLANNGHNKVIKHFTFSVFSEIINTSLNINKGC